VRSTAVPAVVVEDIPPEVHLAQVFLAFWAELDEGDPALEGLHLLLAREEGEGEGPPAVLELHLNTEHVGPTAAMLCQPVFSSNGGVELLYFTS
jgi:hypothetical protein